MDWIWLIFDKVKPSAHRKKSNKCQTEINVAIICCHFYSHLLSFISFYCACAEGYIDKISWLLLRTTVTLL